MVLIKNIKNPIITPKDVLATNEKNKVDGVFNCGAIKLDDEYLLLCRVAESIINKDDNIVAIPIVVDNNGLDEVKIISIEKNTNPNYIFTDPRSVWQIKNGSRKIVALTSLSHFRIARSKDGINFKIDDKATIFPRSIDEEWGIEDPRITKIEDIYYINYTSVSRNGAGTSLITTKDFINFKRHGIIFAPENKDVAIFPEKINGKYYAFNRPVPCAIGTPDMWIATSPDLFHWGDQKIFYKATSDSWENGRIGGGAVPFLTDKGWIKIYHAADYNDRYCLGAFLLDKNDPRVIIGKTKKPILEPIEDYEINGFFGNVVFTCGAVVFDELVKIYYGAADDKICLAEVTVSNLLNMILEE